MDRLSVLLIAFTTPDSARTTVDHVEAFSRHSRHRVAVLQNYLALRGSQDGRIRTIPEKYRIDQFDAIVFHYSNYLVHPSYLDEATATRLAGFHGLKAIFIQDESRTIDATTGRLRELGFDLVFSCQPDAVSREIYSQARLPGVRVVRTLPGYISEGLAQMEVPPLARRPFDVVYRCYPMPFWMGAAGQERWEIAGRFQLATAGDDLRCNISDRIADWPNGRAWPSLVTSARAMLGTEIAASIADFTGGVQRCVEELVSGAPDSTFEDARARCFPAAGEQSRFAHVSPFALDAVALRTPLVLYEGEHSGVLKPERHYIPLRKDLSNIRDVVQALRDHAHLDRLAYNAYAEVALDPAMSYRNFIADFDAVLETEFSARVAASPERLAARQASVELEVRPEVLPIPGPGRESPRPAVVRLTGVTLDYPVFDATRSLSSSFLKAGVGGFIRRDPRASRATTVRALTGLTFDIERGDRVGLMGPNGAGKSTLLRLLAGGYVPTSGTIEVAGRISSLLSMGVGIDPDETGFENVVTGCLLLGMSRAQISARAGEIIEFTELGQYIHMPVRTYSSGMMIRLAFAIATAIDPEILLIDEVLGVGDASFAAKAEARITRLMDSAAALVLASHANELLRRFCNKGLFLVAGSVEFYGPIEDAIEQYQAWLATRTQYQ